MIHLNQYKKKKKKEKVKKTLAMTYKQRWCQWFKRTNRLPNQHFVWFIWKEKKVELKKKVSWLYFIVSTDEDQKSTRLVASLLLLYVLFFFVNCDQLTIDYAQHWKQALPVGHVNFVLLIRLKKNLFFNLFSIW